MEQQNRTQKDTTRWSGRKKRAIAAVAAAALALVVLPVVCMAVHAKKHGDNNKGKYAICAAHRSRRCQTESNSCS